MLVVPLFAATSATRNETAVTAVSEKNGKSAAKIQRSLLRSFGGARSHGRPARLVSPRTAPHRTGPYRRKRTCQGDEGADDEHGPDTPGRGCRLEHQAPQQSAKLPWGGRMDEKTRQNRQAPTHNTKFFTGWT